MLKVSAWARLQRHPDRFLDTFSAYMMNMQLIEVLSFSGRTPTSLRKTTYAQNLIESEAVIHQY